MTASNSLRFPAWGPHLTVQVVPDLPAIARRGAELFASSAVSAIAENAIFTVALSGGNTPRQMYSLLATDPQFRENIPWNKIHFFWGDERCVPPDHPDSNYRMASETLLSRIAVPPGNIHRISAELADPSQAAALYEEDLRARAGKLGLESNPFGLFDLVLLGMGPDGHTASLFPGTAAVANEENLVVSNWVPRLQANRITLTPPVLREASEVLLQIAGEDKAETVQKAFGGPIHVAQFPVQLLASRQNSTVCLFDVSAASMV